MIDDSSEKLSHQSQLLVRNKVNLNREREHIRKAETRQKIQLGGLIIKAGLEGESSSVLLGLLCDAKYKISIEKEKWRKLGDKIFSSDSG